MPKTSPIRPTDNEARALARKLLETARFGALGVIEPESQSPLVSRVAVGTAPDGAPVMLISDLSQHTRALRSNPACSLMVGEPGGRGDPLTHPRLTLQGSVTFARKGDTGHADLRTRYLETHPKSKLYIDFADFVFARMTVTAGYLNGGFGKAFVLTPKDLAAPSDR